MENLSSIREDHLDGLSQVLTRIGNSNLKVSPKKCHFFQSSIQVLSHVVFAGVGMDFLKIQTGKKLPVPTTVKELRPFPGLCSHYQGYIPNFVLVARPFHKLTEKESIFKWTLDSQTSFEQLKHLLTSSLIIAYPAVGVTDEASMAETS